MGNESFSGHIHIVSIEKYKLIFDKIRGIEKRYAFYTAMQAKSEYHRISNELSGQYQRRITEYIKRIEDIWKLHDKQRYEQHQKEIDQFIKKREQKIKNDNAMEREIKRRNIHIWQLIKKGCKYKKSMHSVYKSISKQYGIKKKKILSPYLGFTIYAQFKDKRTKCSLLKGQTCFRKLSVEKK